MTSSRVNSPHGRGRLRQHGLRPEIRDAIRTRREALGWDQTELGRKARPSHPISHATISRIESGRTDTQVATLEAICRALGIAVWNPHLLTVDPDLQSRYRQQLLATISHDLPQAKQLIDAALDAWQKLQFT